MTLGGNGNNGNGSTPSGQAGTANGAGVGGVNGTANSAKPSRPASLNELIDAVSSQGGSGEGSGEGQSGGEGQAAQPPASPSGQAGQGQPASGQAQVETGLVAALARAGFDVEGMSDGEVAEMIEELQRKADSSPSGQVGQVDVKPRDPAPPREPQTPADPRTQNRVEESRQAASAEAEKAAAIAAAKAVKGDGEAGKGDGEGDEGKPATPSVSRFKAPAVSEQALRLQAAGVVVQDQKTGLYKAGDAALQKYADELNAYEQNRREFTRRLVDDPEAVVMDIVGERLKSLEESFEKRVAEAAKAEVERFKSEREAEAKQAEVQDYFEQQRAKLVQRDADGKELTEIVDGEEVPKLTKLGDFYVRVYETLGHIQDNAARMRQALEIAEQAERIHASEGDGSGDGSGAGAPSGKSAGAGVNGSTPGSGGNDVSAGNRKRGLLRRSRDAQEEKGQGGAVNGRTTAPAPTHVEQTRRNRLDMWELIQEHERVS